ncbi:CaiB/BaiF CoA transferase family protein [Luteithermobacter gelatinilyticus]|uniref:CaiB/BaiF CoA transferase family protein n=1 Tax=Luteithermobacter gelatinilyticus TaxID=2582913 RepID=UPI0011074F16|nr:CaiB/BaiF CoA-transferase family protein [Luteithermobacter gelatinilyticus]
MADTNDLPLDGVKVIEFTHMVMGPTVGVILADLGAEVIKVEPPKGDNTRRLVGSGSGYFPMYNRNKKSLSLDLKSPEGLDIAHILVRQADVVIENFRPGTMDKLGLGYEVLSQLNERLIYCSEKGFLAGPYEHRTALDEVAQMMGGLAYMTGPPGRPLRAGSSVIDVMGGMFGVIGVLAALKQREITGKGQYVQSALFESTVFLVGQHMAQYAVTGQPANPMPVRISAWAIYEIFETADDEQVFVGVVSDTQWGKFCEAFGLEEWRDDPAYATNAERVRRRDDLIPQVKDLFRQYSKKDLMDKLEHMGLPFAPISRPEEMFDDPHLTQSGGLVELTIPDGEKTRLPALPLEMNGRKFGVRHDLPQIGEQSYDVLKAAGLDEERIRDLADRGVVKLAGKT